MYEKKENQTKKQHYFCLVKKREGQWQEKKQDGFVKNKHCIEIDITTYFTCTET